MRLSSSQRFRSRILGIVAAAAAPTLGACCHVSESIVSGPLTADGGLLVDAAPDADDATADGASPDATVDGSIDCQQSCQALIPRGCGGEVEITACEVVQGTLRCSLRSTSCPIRPALFAACGRRFDGPCEQPGDTRSNAPVTAMDWLQTLAHLEAEAVPAFQRLARELAAHGAPRALVDAAERASRDEMRHARVMRRLVAARGGDVATATFGDVPMRDLAEIARENAVEGCTREMYGAVVAAYQAEHARDASVRRAARSIARDEARHAWLAWQIDAWLRERLDADTMDSVDRARSEALTQLAVETAALHPGEGAFALGIPTGNTAIALVREMQRVFAECA